MIDDIPKGQPLFLAKGILHHERDTAHRNHLLLHNQKHKRQATATDVASTTAVTEVIQTVSVVQQVDVNSDGSTFSTETVPETSLAAATTTPLIATTTASSAAASTTNTSLTSSQGTVTSTSTPLTSFTSFTVTSNSTACKSGVLGRSRDLWLTARQ